MKGLRSGPSIAEACITLSRLLDARRPDSLPVQFVLGVKNEKSLEHAGQAVESAFHIIEGFGVQAERLADAAERIAVALENQNKLCEATMKAAATSPNTPRAVSLDDVARDCNGRLQMEGVSPYPRTCRHCVLGPCPYRDTLAALVK